MRLGDEGSDGKTRFPRNNFAISHSGSNGSIQPVLYSLFIETTTKHDTPVVVVTPPLLQLAPLWRSARSQNPRSVYCWRNGAMLHSRRRIDRQRRKKGRRNVGPSLWNYVTVNWANTTGAPWPAGPNLHFACATGPLQHGLNIELRATKVTPIWTRHLTRRSSRDAVSITWKNRNSIVCVARARMHKEK